ncbi:MAG: AIR synthase related protein, partial [Verrucomicrobiota bacterium]
PGDYQAALLGVASVPSVASKRWVYRQYDHMVRLGSLLLPGSDAAVVRMPTGPGSWKYLAASTDCNAHYCYLNPRRGALIAVAECVRNLAMTGAEPLALTDNLNFANPHNPERFWELAECVDGLAEGCRFFGIPVTGGNVSLYNQNPKGAIEPTPTVGVVGLIEEEAHVTPSCFQAAGDAVLLIGGWGWEIAGTVYARELHRQHHGDCPQLDLENELNLHRAVRALIRAGLCRSAHDLSEGGFGLAALEACIAQPTGLGASLGADLRLPDHQRLDVTLFNESQSRAIVTVPAGQEAAALQVVFSQGIGGEHVGHVTTAQEGLTLRAGETTLQWSVAELEEAWGKALGRLMQGEAAQDC